jgi:hypothetical protein
MYRLLNLKTVETMTEKFGSELTPVTVIPTVHIIVRDKDAIRAMIGGDCPALAQLLHHASEHFGSMVTRRSDVLTPLGQDIYDISYDYLMMVRGALTFLSLDAILKLEESYPSTLKYSVVVTR